MPFEDAHKIRRNEKRVLKKEHRKKKKEMVVKVKEKIERIANETLPGTVQV